MRTSSANIGAGCITLFALPFAASGVLIGVAAVGNFLRDGDAQQAILMGLAAIAFGVAGFGLIFAARYGRGKLLEEEKLRTLHPGMPWLWDEGWAAGRIRSQEKGIVAAAWVFAILWNSISAPVLFFVPEEVASGNRVALVALLFPLVGLGLLTWALRATARWRRFGTSELILETTPAPVGGELRGVIRTRLEPSPEAVQIALTCVRRTDRGGDDGVSESVIWHGEDVIEGDGLRGEAGGTLIPIAFAIPADAVPTERTGGTTTIHWRLEATAAIPGVDFRSRFEVPVFRVPSPADAGSTVAAASATAPRGPMRKAELPFDPANASVSVAPGPGGCTEIRFGVARNKGVAASVTVMLFLFGGATAFGRALGAPVVFMVPFVLLSLFLLFYSLDQWLGTTTLEVTGDAIRHRSAILGIGRTREIRGTDIARIDVKSGMTQQETLLQKTKVWFDIAVEPHIGRPITVGRGISDRREAEWLAATLRQLLGIEQASS